MRIVKNQIEHEGYIKKPSSLMNEAVVKCKISDGSEYILTIVTFPTAIIQIIHHGWIQNH